MDEPSLSLRPELLLEHAAWVRRLAGELVADAAAADDVAQQTLLTALQRPPPRADHPRAWLATVARSIAGRMRRAADRRRHHESRIPPPRGEQAASDVVAHASLHRTVVDAVLALDEPYRATILLRFFEELEPRAVAQRLDVPLETVRTRLKRGLALLRARLQPKLGGEGAWLAALLPIAELPPGMPAPTATVGAATASASIPGAFLMVTKLNLAVAAIVLAAAAGAAWRMTRDDAAEERSDAAKVAAAPRGGLAASPTPTGEPAAAGGGASAAEREPIDARAAAAGAAEERGVVASLRGRVLDADGVAIPDALVFLCDARGEAGFDDDPREFAWRAWNESRNAVPSDDPPRQRTQHDGSFRFDFARHGMWHVGVIHATSGFAWKHFVRVKEDGKPVFVELTLEPGVVIRGSVTDADGNPLPRAELAFAALTARHPTNPAKHRSESLTRATTDDEGRYATLPLPLHELRPIADVVLAGVSRRGYFSESRIELVIAPGAAEQRADFRLPRSRTFRGRLFDSSGAPIRLATAALPDLHVRACRSDPRTWAGRHDAFGADAELDRERDEYLLAPDAPGITHVGAFSGATLLASAAVPATGDSIDLFLDLARIEPAKNGGDSAEPLGTFGLVVLDAETRAPVREFHVTFRETTRDNEWGRGAHDEGGRFRSLELTAGRVDVAVHAQGYLPAVRVVEIVPGVEPAPIELLLTRGGASIAGRVLDADGKPLADAHLFLLGSDGEPALPMSRFGGSPDSATCEEWTEDDGRFRFPAIPPGDYVVVAEPIDGYGLAPVYASTSVERGPVELELRAKPGVRLSFDLRFAGADATSRHALRVRDEAGTLLIDDLRHRTILWRGPFLEAHTVELAPGRYSVEVIAPGFRPANVSFTAADDLIVPLELVPERP